MSTDVFRATPHALRLALPHWKEPLPAPVQRSVMNPFTRQLQALWSWDPEPTRVVGSVTPLLPPGPAIDLTGLEFRGVLALVDLFAPDDAPALRRALFAPDSNQGSAYERKPARIGPYDIWVWAVPSFVTTRLATMSAAEVASEGPRWAAAFQREAARAVPGTIDLQADDFYADALGRLCALARDAAAAGESLFEWVVPDY